MLVGLPLQVPCSVPKAFCMGQMWGLGGSNGLQQLGLARGAGALPDRRHAAENKKATKIVSDICGWLEHGPHLHQWDCVHQRHQYSVPVLGHSIWNWQAVLPQGNHEGVLFDGSQA